MPKVPIFLFILFVFILPVKSQLLINEFQASNITTALDPSVNFRQWIEIYNAGNYTIDLYDYYLSDQSGELQKYHIYEHIYVSPRNRAIIWIDPDNKYYGQLKLDMDGGDLSIANSSGDLMDHISYPQQYIDISYGRESDGSADCFFFKDPTPNGTNNSSGYTDELFPDSLIFALPGGFYSDNQILALSTGSTQGEIRYTTNGSWPTESSNLYASPININASMVIRARVYDEDKLPGEVKTNTYFLNEESTIPIISISTNAENFLSGGQGIHVEGYRGIPGLCSEIPVNWNRDWERPINIEYYTIDGKQVINQMAGTKIFGGCSRIADSKSLALYARKRYGDDSFSYQFFSSKDVSEFKGLVLRNSGNDAGYSLLRDGFMQSLVMNKMDIDYLGYQPANVFLNGEYWGILNVREKINEHYVASNYSLDPEQIDMLEKEAFFDWGEVICGVGDLYADLIDFVDQNDFTLEANYKHISTLMDVEEFLNYYLAEIYFENEDWPQNNIKYWRYHGEGGRWRWILFDTDFGWGLYPNSGNSLQWATRGATDDKIIRALLENDNFKNEFIQRMAGFMNTVFHPDTALAVLDSIAGMIRAEIPRHAQKWGKPNLGQFDYQTLNKMPKYAATRPDSIKKYMKYKFGIPGLNTLSLSVDDPHKGFVQAAGVRVPDEFSGEYFRNIPIRMEAVPLPGFRFSHWEGSSNSTEATIYLDFNSDESLKAVFGPASPIENVFFNELGASNRSTVTDEFGQYEDWLEIYNDNDFDVDLAGCFLSDSAGFLKMYQFPMDKPELTSIGPGEYLIIWCDGESAQGALHTNFKLSKKGEKLFLIQKQADALNILDSVYYSDQYSDISYGRNPEADRWDYLEPTPGKANLLNASTILFINEFLTRNDGSQRDEFDEADDWIELFNPSDDSIDIGGLFLTDSLQDPLKHQIPSGDKATMIPPKGYLVLWADGQEEQGVLHLGFKLDGRSEQIGLYRVGAGVIDSLSYVNDYPDVVQGRLPDGSSNIQFLSASPGSGNGIHPKEGLYINEFLAANTNAERDEYGEFDDWIEIYNGNDYPVNIGGIYLSDTLGNPTKHRVPSDKPDSTTIPAHAFLLLWADGQEEQGVLHLGFKLDKESEQIGLYQVEAGMIDSLSYELDHSDIPTGRLPDGSSNIQYLSASPGSENVFDRMHGLFINEFLASNLSSVRDEYGESDDWIEIYNGNDYPLDLGGIFFTDSLGHPTKHRIPVGMPDSTVIPAQGHMLFWADGQEEQGLRHLGFKLDSKSEQIGLYQVGAGIIDSLSYLNEHTDITKGRFPDGNGELQYVSASPGSVNYVRQVEGLHINEFMARNMTSISDEYGEYDDWIEIYNENDFPLDLGGTFITDSLGDPTKHRIPTGVPDSTTIPAHGYLVLWADNQEEQGILHLDFSLSGEGEEIGFVQADGRQFIDSLSYTSSKADQALGLLDKNPGFFQIVSASPGWPNYLKPTEKLYISEILASGNELHRDAYGEYDDWIEIYNDNDFEVDLGGFYLTDSMNHLQKFRIPTYAPDSTTIKPGGRLILWADKQTEQGITHLGFKLSGDGEYLALSGTDGLEIVDSASFPNQFKHFSFSREDDMGDWKFFPPTFGKANITKIPAGLVINEFMASNANIPDDNGEFEDWIEIYNSNSYGVDVGGLYLTDSIGAPTKFRIPSHSPEKTTIDPFAYLLFYADDQKDQGVYHTNFKLGRDGEQIALLHYDGSTIIDSLSYNEQFKNASCSRIEGEGLWLSIPPSPGAENICPDLSSLLINELMAYNRTVIEDDHGEYDSWLELYNNGDTSLDIGGLFFTDSMANPFKFRVGTEYPDSTTIAPYGYLTLWADNTAEQGIRHLDFKIAKTGEEIGIFDYQGQLLDSVFYPFLSPNLSWGRIPDGSEVWTQFLQATPSESNVITLVPEMVKDHTQLRIYPNPVLESATFEIPLNKAGKIRIEIVDSHGSLVSVLQKYASEAGTEKILWNVKDAGGNHLVPGFYMFRVLSGDCNYSGKFVVR